MAPLSIFGGVVPQSEAAKAEIVTRTKQATDIRESAFMRMLATELYGNQPSYGQTESDIFPNPAEQRYGRDFYSHTVPQMGRNVLHYGAEQRKVVNTAEHLELSFLAGVPGDTESELAAEVVRAAWDWNDERDIATRLMASMFEYGFRGAELIYDVITRGEAKNVIAPVAIIPRPETWFGFDVRGRARFKPNGRDYPTQFLREYPLVPELKVMFGRSGDLHTRYGIGTAEWCYPTVYEIHEEMRKLRKLTERAGFIPVIVTTPFLEGTADYEALKRQVFSFWGNALLVSGETETGHTTYQLGGAEGMGAYANAGNMILALVAKKENWISAFLQGSISTSPQGVGSFAKEDSVDDQKMYQAPSWAACKEAMLNRGFVRPIMLINFPTLEREKWPRASVDASFGEDQNLFMATVKDLVGMGMPISWVTVSERTGIPIADDGEPLLTPSRSAIAAPADPTLEDAVKAFSEPTVRMRLKNGQFREVAPDTKILTQHGVVRAGNLKGDGSEIMLADPERYLRLVR